PPGLKSRIASLRPSTLEPAYYAIPGIRSRDVSESPRAPHRHIHPRLRGVDGDADGRLPQAAREETPPDGRGCVPVPTRDLLPVGRAALLRLMGRETADVHLGSRTPEALEQRLAQLDCNRQWCADATERMAAATRKDHKRWAKHCDD